MQIIKVLSRRVLRPSVQIDRTTNREIVRQIDGLDIQIYI